MQLLEVIATAGIRKLSERPTRIKDKNGDYVYKKGMVVGRFGRQDIEEDIPMYLYTNRRDREIYSKRFDGREDQQFYLTKDVISPNEEKQIVELYYFTKDRNVLDDPFEYWKDKINQWGPIADGYFKYMKNKGYDALIDLRNAGVIADDPILLLDPKKCLKNI